MFFWHPRTHLKGKPGPEDLFLWLNNTLSTAEVGLKDTTVNKKQNRDVLLVQILGTNLIVSFPNHSYESKMYWKMKAFASKDFGAWSENTSFTYVIPQPSVGLLLVSISVSKRRSICWYFSFHWGNKIDLYQFSYRLLGQDSNFNYTDINVKQCPCLVLKNAPLINGKILPYSSYIHIIQNFSPVYGQR